MQTLRPVGSKSDLKLRGKEVRLNRKQLAAEELYTQSYPSAAARFHERRRVEDPHLASE